MKFNESREMYLEVIYDLINEQGRAHSVEIAQKLGCTKPSVSKAVKLLRDDGFVHMEPYGPITLTQKGKAVAKIIKDKHDDIKKFLMLSLGLDMQTAEEDACRMEHIVSRETMIAISDYVLSHS
jgi:Mn-dependent DtxR family transcriptional regulator